MLIPTRFNGPPGSANGGWSAGLFATTLVGAGPAEVTLRRPPPLAVTLSVDGSIVRDPAGEAIAEVRPVDAFASEAVPPVDRSTAATAATGYPGFTEHPFPTCYVCGPDHPAGLRIFPGGLPDGRTAAPFTVPDDVSPATIWAALDCPGGWAVIGAGRPYVLGRIAAAVVAMPAPGEECVVVGRLNAAEGRKAQVRTSLYGPAGALLGYARATWIAI
ncbi:hypothetical protein [Plantactinospora sp. GCM10030261]|uniref:hypothetical protein n=1 Tax=Plantactinospora sp. GCM10030261 TaxID=3273420 RepID=UPI003614C272